MLNIVSIFMLYALTGLPTGTCVYGTVVSCPVVSELLEEAQLRTRVIVSDKAAQS